MAKPEPDHARASVLHIDSLAATLAVAHFQGNLFALLHILLARALQHGRMQEDILAAIFWRHEAEAAHLVEPLHRTSDVIGRPALIAAKFTARRGTIPKIATRGTVTEAAAAAKAAATTAEVTARGTITEIAARRTVTEAAAAKAATTTAEVTARGTITEIAARGTIPKATTTAEFTAWRARFAAAFALLQLHDPRDQAPALPVRPDFTNQLIAGIRRFDACLCQGRGVKEHILPIRTQYEAEAFTGVIPLHLGLDWPGAILVLVFRKHCLTIHTKMTATRGMQRWYLAA
jgi:hypothetical protein